MADFEGILTKILRPGDAGVPIRFAFAAASTSSANDGSIPYGTTISTAAIKVYTDAGSSLSSVLDAGSLSVVGGAAVTATLTHPASVAFSGRKTYTAVLTLTLNTGAIMSYECARLIIDGARG